ncbi:MAG: hypothetical protein WBW03_25200, partial [Silvibacterium sp.]
SSASSLLINTIAPDDRSENDSLYPRTIFKIHNPSRDHRVRGKRLRLPSHPRIESASQKHRRLLRHRARGASDLG